MKAAGFNVTRLAEFAWVNMEPREGEFDFGWLDDAIEILGDAGVQSLVCTPTAIMPAWVARKYPDVMAMQQNGMRIGWGVRKHNCFNSGAYNLLSERITEAMAQHFAGNRNVIGWQTDNEFIGSVCVCDSCLGDFQDWLQMKYASLDALNRAWGTHFWGQKYMSWQEIVFPLHHDSHNPSACLDWKRYSSWLNVRFQRKQIEIIREHCPKHFVTHNLMGFARSVDYYDLAEDLDFASWDNYPVGGKPEIRYASSAAADLMRGVKRKNFWIMEQTAGPAGWGRFGRNPRPGEIRSVAYQQLAHGADGQVWFRWRTCTAGREQYWHGLLGHDGRALRRYREAKDTATEYKKLEKHLAGTTVKAKVAMIYDYDSIWALEIQPGCNDSSFQQAVMRYYEALFRAGVNVDMVKPDADLSTYKVVIAPMLHVLTDSVAEGLNAFVHAGGVLLTDIRTGVKDADNLCHERTLPGKLSAALGIEIEEYGSMNNFEYEVEGTASLDGMFTATKCIDWVKPVKADKIAGYTQWHLKKFAAVTRNTYGKGTGWYVGSVIKEPEFYDKLIASVLANARVRPVVRPPEGVEVSVRQGAGKRVLFLVNHTEEKKVVTVPAGKRELLSNTLTKRELTLGRHDVAVIKL